MGNSEVMTIQEILNAEQAAGREPRLHWWYRQFRLGRLPSAEKVSIDGVATWQCEKRDYLKFVANNTIEQDVDQIARFMRETKQITTGANGWYSLFDAAKVLRQAGYKKVSEHTLGRYCNRGLIKFRYPENKAGRVYARMISIETMRNWGSIQLKAGKPHETIGG